MQSKVKHNEPSQSKAKAKRKHGEKGKIIAMVWLQKTLNVDRLYHLASRLPQMLKSP